ncbi:MAG TPA: hypothetical protein VGI39_07500, partial [Polyangiaceae bacterium]
GARPFEGTSAYALTHAILHAPLGPPSARNANLPAALDAVVMRAMSRDAEGRFACVDDFSAALLPFAEPEVAARWASEFAPGDLAAETIPPVAPVEATARGRSSRWTTVSLAALGGLAIAIVAARARVAPGREVASAILPTSSAKVAMVDASVHGVAEPPVESAALATKDDTAAQGTVALDPHPVTSRGAVPAGLRPRPSKAKASRGTPPSASTGGDGSQLDNGAPLLDPR